MLSAYGGIFCAVQPSKATRGSGCAGSPRGCRQSKCPPLPPPRTRVPFDHLLQRLQRTVVTVQVVEDARRIQMLQRHLGHDLCDLLERPCSAGEGDKGVSPSSIILRLRSRHVLGHDEPGQAVVLEFALDKTPRLDAGHLSRRSAKRCPRSRPSARIWSRRRPAHFRLCRSMCQAPEPLPAKPDHCLHLRRDRP